MAFKYAIAVALAFVYLFSEPVVNANIRPGDYSGEVNTDPDDPNRQEVDIKVKDPEMPIAVNIIDQETLRSAQYIVLYGGTGSPDSTPKPFPLSFFEDNRKASLTLHLINNKTSEVIDSADLPPNAYFIPEGATKVLSIDAYVVDGFGLIEFTNLAPERSIILNLVNPSNAIIIFSDTIYTGTDESVPPIVLEVDNHLLPNTYIVVTTRVPPNGEVKGLRIIYLT